MRGSVWWRNRNFLGSHLLCSLLSVAEIIQIFRLEILLPILRSLKNANNFLLSTEIYFHLQFLLNLFSWLTICRSRLGSRTSLGSCFLKNNVILESSILSLKIVFISQIFFCLHQHPARESQVSWMVIEMSLFHLIGVKSFVELNHWSSVNVVCSTSFQDNLNCLTWDCWGYSVFTSPWSLRSRSTEDTRYINNK